MQCKNHPDRRAEQFCSSCQIPLCADCAEETKPGEYYCFKCAMLVSVSAVGTTIKGKREKHAEQKAREKKKRTPFHYFVMVSSVMILVMWGVILFGGQEAPAGTADLGSQPRVLLFMVDGALKRFAHYEGNQYPGQLTELIPRYLSLRKEEIPLLDMVSYARDPSLGYRLSLAKPKPGEMNIIISPKGVRYETLPGGGS
ncbi:MAG: B-box zinc finger protein [Deltaproteobacteria bacterium]